MTNEQRKFVDTLYSVVRATDLENAEHNLDLVERSNSIARINALDIKYKELFPGSLYRVVTVIDENTCLYCAAIHGNIITASQMTEHGTPFKHCQAEECRCTFVEEK